MQPVAKTPQAPDQPHQTPRTRAEKSARQRRLAEEMRKNLLKRKAQRREKLKASEPADEK